ncbi:MAG: hypothetical protein LJU34_01940, partial [Oscillospiraceae bacterium]|nr:hypothetical protein [Oscillospiraceae bacterium]
TTEESAYSDDAAPFAMLIEFGDIVSYSDFLASAGGAAETAAESTALEGKDAFDAYVQYLRDYMDTYEGEGDGSGFDDSAKTMALGELDTVAYGDDVNDFPFEMFVSQFGADDYDTWLASQK